jgi:quinol monooxygenase YgiN
MSDEKIVLVARLKVKKEMVEEAKTAALALVEVSRAESGCENYDVHQAIDDETVFVWHETWATKTAPYFAEFFATVEKIAETPPQITLTKMIS